MVRIGKFAVALLTAAALLFSAAESVSASPAVSPGTAADSAGSADTGQALAVRSGSRAYPGRVRLEEGTAWVSLREFSLFADGGAKVRWDGESRTASVHTDALALSVRAGERIMEANGRLLLCPEAARIDGSLLWVPLRTAARAFGFSCSYDPAVPEAVLTREGDAVAPRDEEGEDRVFWLSRIIEAEAGAEPFEGKLAVGSVILNRMLSDEFPDTVWGVIFDDRNGVQFTPTENGSIWRDPGEDSVRAACVTLDNPPLWDDIEYFLNPDIAESLWIPAAREYAFTIGGHAFYK